MDNMIRIDSLRWYSNATERQIDNYKQAILHTNIATILIVPNPADPDMYMGIVLTRYYTEALSKMVGVRSTRQEGDFCYLDIGGITVRGFVTALMRKVRPFTDMRSDSTPASDPDPFDIMRPWDGTILVEDDEDSPKESEPKPRPKPISKEMRFLQSWTPAKIQQELDEYVIGQSELTRAVAEFLYYHALRQLHPHLPQRPLLISGPSGSGKTEVWRVAAKLFGHVFPIRIIDGSNISCEGWSGNYKLDTYIDATMVKGGILVVDEFDKLTKPRHSSNGDNVSLDIQAEFLKLIEGEYRITEKRKLTDMTSKNMGFVLVGAFESLRAKKKKGEDTPQVGPIGFCTQRETAPVSEELTDEDFIAYGIIPEIVGRIAVKCASEPLPDSAYMDILMGPHSRVSQLVNVLAEYGIEVSDVISPQALMELVAHSKSNQTGVRWVSAQVETRLLEAVYEQGLFQPTAEAS